MARNGISKNRCKTGIALRYTPMGNDSSNTLTPSRSYLNKPHFLLYEKALKSIAMKATSIPAFAKAFAWSNSKIPLSGY